MATTAFADQEAFGVQVVCDSETNTVKVQLISTMDCGDGHCANKDYEETAEGKAWLDKQVTWMLPNKSPNTFSCNFSDNDLIKVKISPIWSSASCNENARVKIFHNQNLVLNRIMIDRDYTWYECNKQVLPRSVEYKLSNDTVNSLGIIKIYDFVDLLRDDESVDEYMLEWQVTPSSIPISLQRESDLRRRIKEEFQTSK